MASRAKRKLQRRVSQSDSRRHHYVPAGYLAFFAQPQGRNGKLHVWDKEQGKGWISTPNNVAWVEDLYRLDDGGPPPHAIEEALAKAERVMIKAIREIAANPLRPPTVSQAESIVAFVSLQFVRGPEQRDDLEGFMGQLARSTLQMATENPEIYESHVQRMLSKDPTMPRDSLPTYEEAREGFRDDSLEMRINNSYLVRTLLETQDVVFKVMAGMKLSFHWISKGEEFVTASRPVVLVPSSAAATCIPPGIATAEAVVMPLTPRLLFMARPREFEIIASPAVPGLATQTNQRLAHQSMQVYSRTSFYTP